MFPRSSHRWRRWVAERERLAAMGRSTFEGTLEAARGGGAFIPLPAGVLAELGGTRRRVRGSLNGVEFQSSTMPTGGGTACLGGHKATRGAAGAEVGGRGTGEGEPA